MNSNTGSENKDVVDKVTVVQGELFGDCKLHDITEDFPKVPRCKNLVSGIKCQVCTNLLNNTKKSGTN